MSSEYMEMRQKAVEMNAKIALQQDRSIQIREKIRDMFGAISSTRTDIEDKNRALVENVKGFESMKSNPQEEPIAPKAVEKSLIKRKVIL